MQESRILTLPFHSVSRMVLYKAHLAREEGLAQVGLQALPDHPACLASWAQWVCQARTEFPASGARLVQVAHKASWVPPVGEAGEAGMVSMVTQAPSAPLGQEAKLDGPELQAKMDRSASKVPLDSLEPRALTGPPEGLVKLELKDHPDRQASKVPPVHPVGTAGMDVAVDAATPVLQAKKAQKVLLARMELLVQLAMLELMVPLAPLVFLEKTEFQAQMAAQERLAEKVCQALVAIAGQRAGMERMESRAPRALLVWPVLAAGQVVLDHLESRASWVHLDPQVHVDSQASRVQLVLRVALVAMVLMAGEDLKVPLVLQANLELQASGDAVVPLVRQARKVLKVPQARLVPLVATVLQVLQEVLASTVHQERVDQRVNQVPTVSPVPQA